MTPVALSAGVLFHVLFNVLITEAIDNTAKGANGDAANILVSLLFVAAFTYVFMIVAITLSGLAAWLSLRFIEVPHAGKAVLLATPILCITWYLFIRGGLTEDIPAWMLSAMSFITVYVGSLLLVTKGSK